MHIARTLAVTAASGALLAGLSAPVVAQTDSPLSQEASSPQCGVAEVTFTNDASAPYTWSIVVGANAGGALQHHSFTTVPAGESETVTVNFEEDQFGGSAFVSYGVVAGPEQDFFLANEAVGVDTDCSAPEEERPAYCDDAERLLDYLHNRFPNRDFPRLEREYEQRCT